MRLNIIILNSRMRMKLICGRFYREVVMEVNYIVIIRRRFLRRLNSIETSFSVRQ